MKRSPNINSFILLLLPVIAVIIFICTLTPTPEFKSDYLKKNCSSQSLWMYKKLYTNTSPVDAAFFGSSHTLQGINDSLMPSTINFGYCRFGRDIQYALFEEVLRQKKIKTAFFEISETEPSYSHADYPFAGSGKDIFLPAGIYNQAFLINRYDAFLYRLAYLRSILFKSETTPAAPARNFGYIGHDGIADSSYMESEKKVKLADLKGYDPRSISRKVELSFSSYYLTKIKKLAEENNCKVYFMYLPAFGNNTKNSLDSAFYKPFFETLIPPDSILNVFSNWHDAAHLNDEGSKKISKWLTQIKAVNP